MNSDKQVTCGCCWAVMRWLPLFLPRLPPTWAQTMPRAEKCFSAKCCFMRCCCNRNVLHWKCYVPSCQVQSIFQMLFCTARKHKSNFDECSQKLGGLKQPETYKKVLVNHDRCMQHTYTSRLPITIGNGRPPQSSNADIHILTWAILLGVLCYCISVLP